jgi:hypothetical protein
MLHETRDAILPGGFDKEMDVIGHETEAVDADRIAVGKEVEPLKVGDGLPFGEKDLLFVVAALADVIHVTTAPIASPGCRDKLFGFHTNESSRGRKVLTYFWGAELNMRINSQNKRKRRAVFGLQRTPSTNCDGVEVLMRFRPRRLAKPEGQPLNENLLSFQR